MMTAPRYSPGDIIGDKFDKICIEEVTTIKKMGRAHVTYRGPLLTRNGQLRKRGGSRVIQEAAVVYFRPSCKSRK